MDPGGVYTYTILRRPSAWFEPATKAVPERAGEHECIDAARLRGRHVLVRVLLGVVVPLEVCARSTAEAAGGPEPPRIASRAARPRKAS